MRCRAATLLLATTSVLFLNGCEGTGPPDTSAGVSWQLAQQRSRVLTDVKYEVALAVPRSVEEPIRGRELISFSLDEKRHPLVIDFEQPASSVLGVSVAGSGVEYELTNGHIVVPAEALSVGRNRVEIEFVAGEGSLNRNEEFLYTLFVPDRARFAFPCFDQPDLKARFRLELEVPADWVAVANSSGQADIGANGETVRYSFRETAPISTYVFSFVTGKFEYVTAERDGRLMRMYHRETDSLKVTRNSDPIFDLHAAALAWLEDYTGIEYPFEKFDFVLIPAFQYGGMEHPGAILYRAARLLLDGSATQDDRLDRASLIAHETSHMWFGDLVTMKWFDDVWTKEVFANFMAAKIVNPSFPDVDHDLRFLLAHYPQAYEIDRSEGANPIRQELENLNQAGTLYGAIIYQKAPIVMKHLEILMGEENLQGGLREYLDGHRYGNATWPELIEILDARTEQDLKVWSHVWVEEARRPTIETNTEFDGAGKIASLVVSQSDPDGRGRLWNQSLGLALVYPHRREVMPVQLSAQSAEVSQAKYLPEPDFILPNGEGIGYGLFRLDQSSLDFLVEHAQSLPNALSRGVAWLNLWEAMLEGRVAPKRIVELAATSLAVETDELLVQRILSYLALAYWSYLRAPDRVRNAANLELLLWNLMEGAPTAGLKASYFNTFRSLALTDSAVDLMERVWRRDLEIEGLQLSERDYTRLAQELAVREVAGWEQILDEQQSRIENPDRKLRFAFVRPALSAEAVVRDRFFESLREHGNREHEPWVLEAVRYLHHPLRAAQSEKHILPSLELVEEIQATGDIFFPKGWLDATLEGHNTQSAAAIVRRFLDERPGYPPRLRAKILQSADGLFRSVAILEGKA